MRAKLIVMCVLSILIFITILLQMTIFGNYEDMEDAEYDYLQINIDFERMARSIMELLNPNKSRRSSIIENESDQEELHGGELTDKTEVAPILKGISTVPTVPVLNRNIHER